MRSLVILSLAAILLNSGCNRSQGTFRKLSPSRSGIKFFNELIENDTLNYTKFPYMYMGGGISIGDINNDGLDDIFFTGNLVPNRLYLNKGNLRFEDISEQAGIMGNHQWFTGSTMADVNNDGWLDIYVCVSGKYPPSDNLLFINNHDNTFTECAEAYGINDKSSSVQATFFDYNNDGLLDLYVANYPIVLVSMGAEFYRDKMKENKFEESGHLFRNNGNNTFTNVTDEAGLRNFGMSIGLVAVDFNNDGWKDIYISNDFNPPDYFYMNNKDGTFTEVLQECTFQTSIFGMGLDAADINNDGLLDMYQIDMTPEEHTRRMINVIPMRQETFDNSLNYGFHYQYMQNSLQINNGVFANLSIFSNISLFAGVAYTDWSWGGLLVDLDNDGNKDLFVTNGVMRDINNQDIMSNPRFETYFEKKKTEYRPELFPSTPVPNYAFKNKGDLTFTDKTKDWGFTEPTLSNGVSSADLDNDGDLDLVVHNINEVSFLYENKISDKNHYIKIILNGPEKNLFGLGTIVTIKTGNTIQKQELTLTRGYQSSLPPVIHFGTGAYPVIEELDVIWPDGKKQSLKNVKSDHTLVLKYSDAVEQLSDTKNPNADFKDITLASGIDFIHKENNYNDFEFEPLLPYRYSRQGPGLAVADINNDGLEDFFISNGEGYKSELYIQNKEGRFSKSEGKWSDDLDFEITGAILFDADGDGRKDLYVVSGGNNSLKEDRYFRDRLYLNTSSGFINSQALPDHIIKSGKCVKEADYDKDGDLDLFIGGRIVPEKYPHPASSYILQNNGGKGTGLRFEDVTGEVAPALRDAGLVTDAIWSDFNADGATDLIVVGEWMNIRFFENQSGRFVEVTDQLGFGNTVGWWYCIKEFDIDGDSDNDYIVGNLGRNHRYKCMENDCLEVYYNDFDVNGKHDIVLGYVQNDIRYPINSFAASSRQIPAIAQRYVSFKEFGEASLDEIYGEQILATSLHYKVNTFANVWIENKGKGQFLLHELPNPAQLTSVNDVSEIEYKSSRAYVIAGNVYETEVETPRIDAGIGLVLKYNGEKISSVPPAESGLIIKGEVKNTEVIKLANGRNALIIAVNSGPLRIIEINTEN